MRMPKGRIPPLLKTDFPNLPGIADEPFAFIEAVQPYNQGVNFGYRDNPNRWLRILAKLSNIDKHRHLNLTVARVWLNQEIELAWGGANWSFQTLDSGAELERVMGSGGMYDAVKMKRRYSSFVAFDEGMPGDDRSFPEVENILGGCLETTKAVVGDFEKFMK